jgi:hypothetical protein
MTEQELIEFLHQILHHVYQGNGTPETETCAMCKAAYMYLHYNRLPDDWDALKATIDERLLHTPEVS